MADSPCRCETESTGAEVNTSFNVTPRSFYQVECWREGVCIWREEFYNLVTTAGRNKLLDACFKTGEAANQWFVGLVDNASFTGYTALDTMASHAGWLDNTSYSNGTRPAYVASAPSGGSMDNIASRAVFNINASATIRGAFLTDSSVVGGAVGTLYGEGDFTLVRIITAGDTINIGITLTD